MGWPMQASIVCGHDPLASRWMLGVGAVVIRTETELSLESRRRPVPAGAAGHGP
jgi:hypothetical protein